jgi:hypothetical protein
MSESLPISKINEEIAQREVWGIDAPSTDERWRDKVGPRYPELIASLLQRAAVIRRVGEMDRVEAYMAGAIDALAYFAILNSLDQGERDDFIQDMQTRFGEIPPAQEAVPPDTPELNVG